LGLGEAGQALEIGCGRGQNGAVTEKPPKPAASAKEKRLAEALRENLKRRKEASKGPPPDKE
jgi:hypothetical protein